MIETEVVVIVVLGKAKASKNHITSTNILFVFC